VALTRIGLVGICVLLMMAGSRAGQDSTARVLTSNDITAEIGTDVDARRVVAQVLTHLLVNHGRREFFLASQMRAEWLPSIPGVEFVRLSDAGIAGHISTCGTYWLVDWVNIEPTATRIGITTWKNVAKTPFGFRPAGSMKAWTPRFNFGPVTDRRHRDCVSPFTAVCVQAYPARAGVRRGRKSGGCGRDLRDCGHLATGPWLR
jgi:hypothetical protein